LSKRPPALIDLKRHAATRALDILDRELATRPFLTEHGYSIADMSVFAYGSRTEEADISLQPYPYFRAWIDRIEQQPGFLATMHGYDVDPHSRRELR
jgi:glutathione S-transferase